MTLSGRRPFACEEQLREFISLVVNRDTATFCGGLPLTAPLVGLRAFKRDEHDFKRGATHGREQVLSGGGWQG